MKLTEKLYSFFSKAFSRDPKKVLALRLRYDGAMIMTVSDAWLTTAVTGGTGANLVIDLRSYTISSLADLIAAAPGYTVEYESVDVGSVGAYALIDVVTDQDSSNGDHLYVYTSKLRMFLEAYSEELRTARNQISEMKAQMSIKTAAGEWLDEHGDYYKAKRLLDETDSLYSKRIIAEALRPRNNNIAMAHAITIATGVISTVIDAELQEDVEISTGVFADSYGLFDVLGYVNIGDVEAELSIDEYVFIVHELVEKFRAGGTHMRQMQTISVSESNLFVGPIVISGMTVAIYPGD